MTDRHQQKPYPLRMPDDLRERLDEAATKNGRSLNAEIVRRLEQTFDLDSLAESKSVPGFRETMLKRLAEDAAKLAVMAQQEETRKALQEAMEWAASVDGDAAAMFLEAKLKGIPKDERS